MAGIIPGILLMLLYMATISILAFYNPSLGPAGPKFSWKERFFALRGGLWEVLVVFIISLGGLFAGWFTPTEAGAVGAGGVLVLTVLEKRLGWKEFNMSIADTTRTTAMIMFLVTGAVIFGRFIAVSRIPLKLPAGRVVCPTPLCHYHYYTRYIPVLVALLMPWLWFY